MPCSGFVKAQCSLIEIFIEQLSNVIFYGKKRSEANIFIKACKLTMSITDQCPKNSGSKASEPNQGPKRFPLSWALQASDPFQKLNASPGASGTVQAAGLSKSLDKSIDFAHKLLSNKKSIKSINTAKPGRHAPPKQSPAQQGAHPQKLALACANEEIFTPVHSNSLHGPLVLRGQPLGRTSESRIYVTVIMSRYVKILRYVKF